MARHLASASLDQRNFQATAEQLQRLSMQAGQLAAIEGTDPADDVVMSQLMFDAQVIALAREIAELNQDRLPRFAPVPAGMTLTLPQDKQFQAAQATTLGEVAREQLGSADRAQVLLDLNAHQLRLPDRLPAGAEVRLPQKNWPALVMFGLLAAFLLLVSKGFIFKAPSAAPQSKTAS